MKLSSQSILGGNADPTYASRHYGSGIASQRATSPGVERTQDSTSPSEATREA